MNRSAPSSDTPSTEIDLSWRMREREARSLAKLIRGSRLTLLHAEPGIGRTELLTGGVLPLLRRRATDAVGEEDREARVVIPFSDRRTRRAGRPSTRVAERAVLFDGWGAQPMAALQTAVLGSLPADAATYARSSRLAPMLGELSRRFDAHFLVILDSFERFWHPALTLETAEDFIEQLSEAVNLGSLRAHFLLSIDDPTDPRLETLRQRIDSFDASAVHLLRWDSEIVSATEPAPTVPGAIPNSSADARLEVPVLDSVVSAPPMPLAQAAAFSPPAVKAAAPKPRPRRQKLPRLPVPRPEPIRTEGVYAFIESTLSQTASDFAPWQDDAEPTAAAAPAAAPAPVDVAPPGLPRMARPVADAAAPARPAPSARADAPAPQAKPAAADAPGAIEKLFKPVYAWSRRILRKP